MSCSIMHDEVVRLHILVPEPGLVKVRQGVEQIADVVEPAAQLDTGKPLTTSRMVQNLDHLSQSGSRVVRHDVPESFILKLMLQNQSQVSSCFQRP